MNHPCRNTLDLLGAVFICDDKYCPKSDGTNIPDALVVTSRRYSRPCRITLIRAWSNFIRLQKFLYSCTDPCTKCVPRDESATGSVIGRSQQKTTCIDLLTQTILPVESDETPNQLFNRGACQPVTRCLVPVSEFSPEKTVSPNAIKSWPASDR